MIVDEEIKHIRVDAPTKAKESRVAAIFVVTSSLAIVTLWAVKARKHDPRDLSWKAKPKADVAAAGPIPERLELLLSSGPARTEEVSRALGAPVARATVCMGAVYGRAIVEVSFTPKGEVSAAQFSAANTVPVGELFKDTCLLSELRSAKIAPGAAPLTATFSVWNLPSKAPSP